MMEDSYSIENQDSRKAPEARYAYYRRCQVFRKGGEQCKGPAEKAQEICYAHAGQMAMALRRERERQAVLAEAVAEMRRRGKPEFAAQDLFMSFDGIQVTVAAMARALIAGRIDCKTAGRLLVLLQTVSKLLRIIHRKKQKHLPLIDTDDTDWKVGELNHVPLPQIYADDRRFTKREEQIWAAHQCDEPRIDVVADIGSATSGTGMAHGPPPLARAA